MKSILLSILLFVCVFIMHAQQAVYTKTIANYNSDFILPLADNGLFVFGDIPFISKFNSNGNVQWTKHYNFAAAGYTTTPRFYEAVYDLDSNIVVVGQTSKTPYNGDAFILKVKQNGDTLWSRKLTDLNITAFVPYDISTTNDSCYVVTGSALSSTGPGQKLFVTKISKRGNLLWSKTYTSSFYQSFGNAIQQSPDSGFVVVGARPFSVNSNMLITKLDKNGNHQWSKEHYVSITQNNVGFDVSINKNHFTVLAYSTLSGLMNFDYNGNLNWSKFYSDYPSFGNGYDSDMRLRRTLDKGFLIINKSVGYHNSWVIRTDSIGNLKWESEFLTLAKIDALQNKNKSFSFIGNRGMIIVDSKSKSQNYFLPDMQVFKADSLGQNPATCYLSTTSTYTTINLNETALSFTPGNIGVISSIRPAINNLTLTADSGCLYFWGGINENKFNQINLYPNPANEKIIFESGNFIGKKINIQLADITGKIVLNQILLIDKETTEIVCSNLQNGIYLLKIFESGLLSKTAKILIAQ